MTVRTDTTDKQVNAARFNNFTFVFAALACDVIGVTIEQVNVLGFDVDMLEQVLVHESVITLRVITCKINVLIHIEGFHVAETHAAFTVKFDQLPVRAQRGASGGKAQHEVAVRSGLVPVDAVTNVLCSPRADVVIMVEDDETHFLR